MDRMILIEPDGTKYPVLLYADSMGYILEHARTGERLMTAATRQDIIDRLATLTIL